jgi:hypothetical protein
MAEFLLEHAVQKSLYIWLPASTNMILPNPATHKSLFAVYVIVDTSFQDSILLLWAAVTRLEDLDGRHSVMSAHTKGALA